MSNSPGPSHSEEKIKKKIKKIKKKREKKKRKKRKKESESIVRNIYISNKLWRAISSESARYISFILSLCQF